MNILISFLLFLNFAQAALPTQSSDVEIIKAEDEWGYENIPRISKVFRGARDISQRDELQKLCQDFVMNEIKKGEAPYFKAWCTLTKDIVIREYTFTANILIRNWP